MPADTPRGFTYPLYTDPQDTAAAIEELARDIDAGMNVAFQAADLALNQPSVKIQRLTSPVVLASGATTNVIFDNQVYDPSNMWGAGTTVTVPIDGVYLVTAFARFDVAAAGGVAVFIQQAGGVITAPVTVTRAPDNDKQTTVSVTALTACENIGETFTVALRQTSGAPMNTFQVDFTVTRVGDL